MFENADFLDPEGSDPVCTSLLVESGRIRARLAPGEPVPHDVRRIDLAGRALAPGFLDLHFHGEFVFAPTDSLARVLERTSKGLLEFGTTGYLVTSVAWPCAELGAFVTGVAEAVAAGREDGASSAITGPTPSTTSRVESRSRRLASVR